MEPLPFRRNLDIRRIGSGGVVETVSANAEERRALAEEFGLLDLEFLEAKLTIEGWSGAGLKVEGHLRAKVVQACVVTLEPVPQSIDTNFVLTFLPPDALASDPKSIAEAEVIVHFDEDDPPDHLVGNSLDLGGIVAEQLVLALDPYPRAPGASLPGEAKDDVADSESPFAALSRLRDK